MTHPNRLAERLEPCPFCGWLDFLKVDDYQFPPDAEGPAWKWGYHVVCSAAGFDNQQRGCGCSSAWGETPDEAIEAWNRRALATPVPGAVSNAMVEFARSMACTCERCDRTGEDLDDISCRARRALEAAVQSPPIVGARVLAIRDLQAAHVERQEEWCPEQKPDLSFRGNEMAGEVGEACNVIKKLERERHGWRGSRATKEQLAEELADVVHTALLCSITAGIDLEPAVIAKFNATSEKNGLSSRLSSLAPVEAPKSRKEAEERVMQDYRWGNLTPLGVANHLKRAGFNLEYATAKANALEAVATEPVAVRQLGGAPDDLHNLIKVVCAPMTIEQIGELCRDVISRRNPALTAPTGDSGALREALAEIANSDDIDNALDPARNKRLAIAALKGEPGK